jgi:predicted TIM-barrel fold metal-dependent hydrolase
MKVDCHVHLIGPIRPSGGNLYRRAVEAVSERFLRRTMTLDQTTDPAAFSRAYANRLAELVDESELDRIVLLAFDRVFDEGGEPDQRRTYLHVPNGYAREVCSAHPGRFLLGASVHPHRPDALDALERVADWGAALIKLLPNTQGIDPADPRHAAYYRRLADLGLPLLVHCGYEHTLPVIDQRFGDPRRLRRALDAGVTVIVAHCGAAGRFHVHETFGAFLELLRDYPSCYGDTAALANFWRSRYLFELLAPDRLAARYGVELEDPLGRLVHGSDFPIPCTPFAFVGRTSRADRRAARRLSNPLDRDIALKRSAGLPEAPLTRAYEEIGIGRRGS